jgi:alpha-amylase
MILSWSKGVCIFYFQSVCLVLAILAATTAAAAESTDWRRQVIYLAIVDRFADGDPMLNDAHGSPVCNDPKNPHAYQGGDLSGLAKKLDYIKELGADAVWLTPIYKGVPDMAGINCGFPGYWADFAVPYSLEIDPRFGTPADFDKVIANAHSKDMKVVLDMVVNHAGYGARLVDERPDWFMDPVNCHLQGDPEIYCPLAGLPDFDHRSSAVRDYLVDIHLQWLRRFPVDAIRMDTVKHVEPEYFGRDWIPAMRQEKPNLYVLGEILDEGSFHLFKRYFDAGFDGLFNFPLRTALISSFAKGQSVDSVASMVQETLERFGQEQTSLMVNLLDNHDVKRFVHEIPFGIPSEDSRRRYMLAFSALLTVPGIPQIYYGNEIGMDGGSDPMNRRFMPSWAFDSEGRKGRYSGYLDKPDEIFDHVSKLLTVRKQHSALQIGSYRELWRQGAPGNANVWAFFREDPQAKSKAIVALNNGKQSTNGPLAIGVQGAFPDGTVLVDVLGQESIRPVVVKNATIALELPAQSAVVLVPAP